MELKASEGELISLKVTSESTVRQTSEQETETDEVEQWERGTRMEGKVDEEVQTEVPPPPSDLSDLNLTDFLKKTLPRMLKVLEPRSSPIQYHDPSWEEEGEVTETLFSFQGPQVEEATESSGKGEDYFDGGDGVVTFKLGVACVRWNCRGTVLAAGYLRQSHGGWCSHKSFVWLWNISRTEEKPIQFEVEGCVTSLAFHPTLPSLLHVGTFNGQINVLDIAKADPFIGTTPVDEYFHREAVNQLGWIEPVAGTPQLYTVSSDGKMLHWEEKTRYPMRGFLISSGEGGLCFASPADDYATFLVGTESGQILKASIPDIQTTKLPLDNFKWKPEAELILNNSRSRHDVKTLTERYTVDTGKKEVDVAHIFAAKPDLKKIYGSPFSFLYEKHDGPVMGIATSPFQRHLFASVAIDGTVHIYNLLLSKSVYILEPQEQSPLTSLLWSYARPLVLFVGCSNGTVYIYDFLANPIKWTEKIDPETRNSVISLAGNKVNRGHLAIGYAGGEVRVVRLARKLCVLQPEEMRKLATFVSVS